MSASRGGSEFTDLSFVVQPGEKMRLRNIRSQPQWNGQVVKVLKRDDMQKGERWQVQMEDKEIVSVAKKNLEPLMSALPSVSTSVQEVFNIRDGDILKLQGLRSQPTWNGKRVKVLSKDLKVKSGDRWQVEILETRDVISVPKKNLLPV